MHSKHRVRYAETDYWNQRYTAQPTHFDWFYGYTALKPLLKCTLNKRKLCLHIGCGNSNLQDGLGASGYSIVNTDISHVVIEQMKEKYKNMPNLSYVLSDVRAMPEFVDCQFGNVLDKGTLDALMCCGEADSNVAQMFSEISRVLSPGGMFLLITLGEPRYRLPLIMHEEYNWTPSVYLLPKVPSSEFVQEDDRPIPINDTYKPIKYIGPLPVRPDGTVEGMPTPWDPSTYFYAYACKKHPLVLPTSNAEKVRMPESWCRATKEVVVRLQKEMGLSPDVLTRGRRTRHVRVSQPDNSNRHWIKYCKDEEGISAGTAHEAPAGDQGKAAVSAADTPSSQEDCGERTTAGSATNAGPRCSLHSEMELQDRSGEEGARQGHVGGSNTSWGSSDGCYSSTSCTAGTSSSGAVQAGQMDAVAVTAAVSHGCAHESRRATSSSNSDSGGSVSSHGAIASSLINVPSFQCFAKFIAGDA
mmetsp:Transcript_28747/g.63304  ORF Transcript_28747/g.63304 Transcript_28747/m.63304 type:complete len:472 (-) Transcript_28747:1214-2629(-)|eukprot:CAMPEP_0202901580 /NCGR_PEP_ID=MMETSP1392-20130828/14337_1 /ASSEMBLY_ACC=CAM_ASM_000868 /TAXON_ID=225041 /ORGANISM="Chlamydomonas chlamydogama, Strain SAG 11-48b" /LENGTH=471 /DNA_ID=CAMNT_0049588163 /DNA_START=198 /DNA_END=1613 /DNA_ORIENTATION=+